jgi:hypothetical protein
VIRLDPEPLSTQTSEPAIFGDAFTVVLTTGVLGLAIVGAAILLRRLGSALRRQRH